MMEKPVNSEEPKSPKKRPEDQQSSDQISVTPTTTGKQEFVGNCKEFRIGNNKNHLKIIGNCNKIRLTHNSGHLEVIGNSTRVKIVKNDGTISYTGNCGKVYLGKGSSNKHVDYIGNNGVLKVVSEENLNIGCKTRAKDCEKVPLGNGGSSVQTEQNESPRSSVKIEAGTTEIHFNPSGGICLQLKNNISIPNLNANCANGGSNSITNSVRIASGTGNIVVNSSYHV